MTIWIDGDACPKLIKEIIFRAAIRRQTEVLLVSNHVVSIPLSAFIKKYQVAKGFDVADNYIVDNIKQDDLVITADIPLADAVVTQGGSALNPRGEMYTADNIKQHLAWRNLNTSLRDCQKISGGSPTLNQKDLRTFANSLDTWITRYKKTRPCS